MNRRRIVREKVRDFLFQCRDFGADSFRSGDRAGIYWGPINLDFIGTFVIFEYQKIQDRQLLELMVGPTAMTRPFVGPPGMPVDKAALLRRAFDATMQDGEFRAEAARIQADLAPTTGEDVQKLVARIYATPRPVVERVKKLLTP